MARLRFREVKKGARFDLSVNRLPVDFDRPAFQRVLRGVFWILERAADDFLEGDPLRQGEKIGVYRLRAAHDHPACVIVFEIDGDVCWLHDVHARE